MKRLIGLSQQQHGLKLARRLFHDRRANAGKSKPSPFSQPGGGFFANMLLSGAPQSSTRAKLRVSAEISPK